MDDQALVENVQEIMRIANQRPNDRCPTCPCCDIGPSIGPNNPGGYCCGAYISGGECHTIVDERFGDVPQTMAAWTDRADTLAALASDDRAR